MLSPSPLGRPSDRTKTTAISSSYQHLPEQKGKLQQLLLSFWKDKCVNKTNITYMNTDKV